MFAGPPLTMGHEEDFDQTFVDPTLVYIKL